MKRLLELLIVLILLILTLTVGAGVGVVVDRDVLLAHAQAPTAATSNAPNFQLIQQAWDKINQVYVDRSAIQSTPLTYGAISGMVDALGDTGHSVFLTPQMVKNENNFTQGQFEGIGAEVQSKNGHVVIVAPIDNSPAQRAGLKAGDIILKANGVSLDGLPLDQAISKILGPAGTQVTLTIMDPQTGATRDVTLTRARITYQNVSWAMLPGTKIADVRVAAFSQGVTQELKRALTDAQSQGATGIVLDLRDDPGGLLDEAVGTASQFLKSGDVLLEKDAQGNITHVAVQSGGVATNLPMAVLVNGGTASAAEIVAGALQDAHRATVIGETTFGTGTVLNQFNLSDGSALMLAVQEWLTPSGRVIWHKGIAPDVSVTTAAANIVLPDAERAMTPAQLQASNDNQLLRALELLGSGKASHATEATAQPDQPVLPFVEASPELVPLPAGAPALHKSTVGWEFPI